MKISRSQLRQLINETIYNHPTIGSLDSEKPYTHLQGYESDDKEEQESIRGMGEMDREWSAQGSVLAGDEWDQMQDMTDDMMQIHDEQNPSPSGTKGHYQDMFDKYEAGLASLETFSESAVGDDLSDYILKNYLQENEDFIHFNNTWQGLLRLNDEWLMNQSRVEFGQELSKFAFIAFDDPFIKRLEDVLNRKFNQFVGKEYRERYEVVPASVQQKLGWGRPGRELIRNKSYEALRKSAIGNIIEWYQQTPAW